MSEQEIDLKKVSGNLKAIKQACERAIREGGAKRSDFEFMLSHAEGGIDTLEPHR